MFHKIREFLDSVLAEFRKVHWPTREATLKSTSVVIVLSIIIAVYLGVADFGLAEAMKILISN